MICDSFAAGIIYQGKNWTKEYQLSYWNRTKQRAKIPQELMNLLDEVYQTVAEEGLKPMIHSKRLKELYRKHIQKSI